MYRLAVHVVTVYFRPHGSSWNATSLRENGAIVFLLLAPLGLIAGEVLLARRRALLGMALLPFAIFLGLFVVAGGV